MMLTSISTYSRRAWILLMTLLIALTIALTVFAMPGCQASGSIGQPPLSPVGQSVSVVVIDAVKIGLIRELASKIEKAYSDGKVNYEVYTMFRDQEQAALNALAGLRSKALSNERVTQDEFNTAVTTFILPLQNLVATYIPTELPAPQSPR